MASATLPYSISVSPSSFHPESTVGGWAFSLRRHGSLATGFPMDNINNLQPKGIMRRSIASIQRDNISTNTWTSTSPSIQKESAPLLDTLKASASLDVAGFHFPGHNRGGAAPPLLSELIGMETFKHDLPELQELDNLFAPTGPILHAQKQAAELFGSSETWFLVGGTTCGVHASIMATCSPGDNLILQRNSHISAISGMVFSGVMPKYIIPEYNSRWDIAGTIDLLKVKKAFSDLKDQGRKVGAVLVTSPTYQGVCCDSLEKITDFCHLKGVPVIVDEAHGAHFKFDPTLPKTALEQGADLAVQSTHKVLSSLTQSSMLHVQGELVDRGRVGRCLQALQSSSPSYLLLASLDAVRAQLSKKPDTIFKEAIALAREATLGILEASCVSVLSSKDFVGSPKVDPLRVTVGVWELGLSGYEADDILIKKYGVISELAGARSLTFAVTLGSCREHVKKLIHAIESLAWRSLGENELDSDRRKGNEVNECFPFHHIHIAMSPRDAFFASKTRANLEESIGKICGEIICPYPPGIPLLFPGEIISERTLAYLMDIRDGGAVISGAADPHLLSILICDV
ncbi:hypothetical protein AMTRI_Chr06g195490 [Amborella trichopoda]